MDTTRWGVVVLAISLVVGCTTPQPVRTTMKVPTLKAHDGQAEQTKDGITIAVQAMMPDNEQNFPEVYKRISWPAQRKNALGQVEDYEREAALAIVPKPAFKVRVVNNTGHAIRFSTVIFRLADNTGKTYSLFGGTAELGAWLENLWTTAMGAGVTERVRPQLTSAVSSLQLMGKGVELLNGDEWNGWLVFNLGINSYEDFERVMNSVNRFTLRLAEVPVETSEAGEVKRTTEFTFHLDKTTGDLRVVCPPGTKQPTLSACNPE